jgi:hypothetical protein
LIARELGGSKDGYCNGSAVGGGALARNGAEKLTEEPHASHARCICCSQSVIHSELAISNRPKNHVYEPPTLNSPDGPVLLSMVAAFGPILPDHDGRRRRAGQLAAERRSSIWETKRPNGFQICRSPTDLAETKAGKAGTSGVTEV